MNSELRSFTLKFAIVVSTAIAIGAGYTTFYSYREARAERIKEENHKRAQMLIQDLVETCDFARMSDDEQNRLQKCGDDVEQAKLVLMNTVDARMTFWKGQIDDVTERLNKVKAIKANAGYWDYSNENVYRETLDKITKEGATALLQVLNWSATQEKLKKWNMVEALKRQQDKLNPKPEAKGKA